MLLFFLVVLGLGLVLVVEGGELAHVLAEGVAVTGLRPGLYHEALLVVDQVLLGVGAEPGFQVGRLQLGLEGVHEAQKAFFNEGGSVADLVALDATALLVLELALFVEHDLLDFGGVLLATGVLAEVLAVEEHVGAAPVFLELVGECLGLQLVEVVVVFFSLFLDQQSLDVIYVIFISQPCRSVGIGSQHNLSLQQPLVVEAFLELLDVLVVIEQLVPGDRGVLAPDHLLLAQVACQLQQLVFPIQSSCFHQLVFFVYHKSLFRRVYILCYLDILNARHLESPTEVELSVAFEHLLGHLVPLVPHHCLELTVLEYAHT